MSDTTPQTKVAIVTGAGRGIGEGCARAFTAQGFAVVIAEKNTGLGLKLESDLQALGFEAFFVETDVTNSLSIENLISQTLSSFGRIDVLVNNAGRNKRTPLLEITQNDWDVGILLNLSSVFLMCRDALQQSMLTLAAKLNLGHSWPTGSSKRKTIWDLVVVSTETHHSRTK